ncbi:MAG: response regulator, partial [Acetivibrionales bacterium]
MYKVMIADDIEILRYDLKRMKVWSETKDFAVEGEAENGLDALKKLRASDYDLLITDIKMPIMGGMDLLKAVSQEKLCPCVVLLSDYTEFAYAREGLLHGAFDYLGKPINNKDL